jgi:LCP family protein required for cell wall assembly
MPDSRAGGGSPDLPPLPPHLDPRGRQRATRAQSRESGTQRAVPRHTRGRIAVLSTATLGAVLSVALLLFSGYAWWNFRDLNNGLVRYKLHTGVQSADMPDIDGKDQNLLLVGNDDRRGMTAAEAKALHTGLNDGSLSTDTMMIVHVPANGAKATLISLPRDSYVDIPGYGKNKLNSAYAQAYNGSSGSDDEKRAAGADELIKTVTQLTGLTIDHYVQVGLLGFYRISNAIGGVTVNLCNAVSDSYSGLHLSAGTHTIEGATALKFVRQRHGLTNGDIDRTQRQRYFLTAAFRKIASAGTLLNPSRLSDLVSAIKKSIWVDEGLNITDLASQMANLSANNIVGKAIPFEGFADTEVGSVVVVDPAKVQAFVTKLIGSTGDTYAKAKTVDPSTVTVSVLNGGAANGAAGTAASTLKSAGFSASAGDSSTQVTSTIIEYPGGMESEAKTLAQYVPGAAVRSGDGSELTLTLGSDGVTAKSTPIVARPSSGSSSSSSSKAVDSGCIN